MAREAWPELHYDDWKDTCATLHMWTQIVGKIRMSQCAPVNHWWHVSLYATTRGLNTGPIPHGDRSFTITFDFIRHRLAIDTADGGESGFPLQPMTVAEFYEKTMRSLEGLSLPVQIWTTPVEVPDPIPFEKDDVHRSYDAEYVERFHAALVQSEGAMSAFKSRFLGKVSPVHLFWGSLDLAVTRFSGRPAPRHPGVPNAPDFVTLEAYSHEVSSCGFWPGGYGMDASYYAYAYPEPPGFGAYSARPAAARYDESMREFILPYDDVRRESDPVAALLEFFQSTYEAAAISGNWDRASLERAA